MKQLDNSEPNEAGIALRWYFHLLQSWAWLIVLAAIVAGAAGYFISMRIRPMYRASTRLLVSAPTTVGGFDPSTGMVTIQTLTTTYSQMVLDRSVLEGVIEQLYLDTTPGELAKSISVDAIPNTQLLEITVQDPNPKRAAAIADTTATVFVARIQNLRSARYAAIRDGLAQQIATMEDQIATTSGQIAAEEQEIAAAEARKAAVMATQLSVAATQTVTAMAGQWGLAATQTVTAMQQQIAAAATQTAAAAPASVEPAALVQLQERLTQYRTIYSNLVLSYEQVRLAEEQTSTNVVVSQSATAPSTPIGPKKAQITLLGAVVGMILAIGGALAAEILDDTVRDPEEIRKRFGVPILGVIARHQSLQGKPVVLAEPRSPVSEAFRSLRTNITYAAVERPLRRLLITSPTPREGKTTVACSLAIVLSQNEKRVVLVDADLRRPQMHQRFGLPNRLGLSDLLVRRPEKFSSVIHMVNPPKLAVLTSGGLPPNPAELLTSHMICKVLDALNHDFDMIVIDAPPMLSVSDAAALAPATDGVILVVRPAMTTLGALKQALQQLQSVGARVLGVVVNGVNLSSGKYGYYYNQYYSKYSHYYAPRRQGLGRLLGRIVRRKKHDKSASAQSSSAGLAPKPLAMEAQKAMEIELEATGAETAAGCRAGQLAGNDAPGTEGRDPRKRRRGGA